MIETKTELFLATATWCGPCKMLKSRLLKEEIDIELKDADDHRAFFKNYNIKSVPRLVVLKNDEVVDIVQGMDDIIDRIKLERSYGDS